MGFDQNRRKFFRYGVRIPVLIFFEDGTEISGIIFNISLKGMAIKFDIEASIADNVKINDVLNIQLIDNIHVGKFKETRVVTAEIVVRHIEKGTKQILIGCSTESLEYRLYEQLKEIAISHSFNNK